MIHIVWFAVLPYAINLVAFGISFSILFLNEKVKKYQLFLLLSFEWSSIFLLFVHKCVVIHALAFVAVLVHVHNLVFFAPFRSFHLSLVVHIVLVHMFPFLPVAVVGDDSLLANHSELVIALLLSFLADSLHFQERVVFLVYYPTVFYILCIAVVLVYIFVVFSTFFYILVIAGVVVKMFDVFLFLLMLLVDSQLHFPVFPFHLVYVLEWFVCLDKPLLFFVPLLYIDVLVLFRKFVDL